MKKLYSNLPKTLVAPVARLTAPLALMLSLGLTLSLAFMAGGCSNQLAKLAQDKDGGSSYSGSQSVLSVVNWNLQTFFDANKSGLEYSDFQKTANWNSQKYGERLQRLGQAISQLDADLYIFEEIENEDVIYDISNELAANGHNWNQRKFWNYSVFAKDPGAAIGIGILSRYPLSDVKSHSMDIRIHPSAQPSARYILEATASINDKPLIILANHWKSKSGGEEKSQIWRDWQENLLGKRLAELKNENDGSLPACIICGDFNRDATEFFCNLKNQPFYLSDQENTILRFAGFDDTGYISVNSLWFTDSASFASEKGSYYYDDKWERIDNIFTAGDIRVIDFEPCSNPPWASAQGIPIAYKIYSGQGWSDHLPLAAKMILP
ncbi:MAG: endonuclease/exonuclease/phosphatase family protein [Treponema sp.]|nr:endonuclease/exonuclease/phosphatase family protein [Treponema sp.]